MTSPKFSNFLPNFSECHLQIKAINDILLQALNLDRGSLKGDSRVCRAHFTNGDFFPVTDHLRPGAVPSLAGRSSPTKGSAASDSEMHMCPKFQMNALF